MVRLVNFKRKILMTFRMPETNPVRTEAKPFPRRRDIFLKIVLPVAHDRHARVRKLHADLMMPPRLKPDFQHRAPVLLLYDLIGQFRALRILRAALCY